MAARRQRRAQSGGDVFWPLVVVDVVQDGDQQQPDRLVEVDELLERGVAEDLRRPPQVGLDDLGGVAGVEQGPGVDEHDRIVVDIDHSRPRVRVLGDLVHVALGGQTGPDVDELSDAGLGDHVAHGPPQEGAIGPRYRGGVRRQLQDLPAHLAVDGVVVLAAELEVIDAGDIGLGRVDPRRNPAWIRHQTPPGTDVPVAGHLGRS
jgi:hypothetical protein